MSRKPTRATSRFLIVCSLSLLVGCDAWWRVRPPRDYDEVTFQEKSLIAHSVRGVRVGDAGKVTSVIGHRRDYRVRKGDTLLDVARYYDLGYNEIVEANPGVDPWLPSPGTKVLLPTQWVLPCCASEGMVLNLPEMRLYFYVREPGAEREVRVITHPIAIGRNDWRTPRGRFSVREKTVDPKWIIPASIRSERARERGDHRRTIAGGHPDNPLGKYRLSLSLASYAIHGTNTPWGIGREVSHGCAQLYPEDIDRLFPLVDVGTPVEIVYQPVKLGMREGVLYVEAHRDVYALGTPSTADVVGLLRRAGYEGEFDRERLTAILTEATGVPTRLHALTPSGGT